MKRFAFIAVALCLAFVMAAPAMATDVSVSGAYRVRGNMVQSQNMRDTAATNAYMEMRLRVNTVFTVTDDLKLTTRFDALDGKRYGATDLPTSPSGNNLDWDRTYMTFNTGIGKFDIGRMSGGTWGTSFIDTVGERDRVKFTTAAGPLTLLGIFEKNAEGDEGITTADSDSDVWYLAGIYKAENFTTGVLYGFVNYKGTGDPAGAATYMTRYHAILPYFTAKFGALRLQGEARINTGDAADYQNAGTATEDKDELAYNLEVGFNMGAFDVEAGYAFISGDNGTNANEDSSFVGFGDDWEKLWILTGSTGSVAAADALGGQGNLSDGGSHPGYGAWLAYAGGSFAVTDQLKLGLTVGYAEADEVPSTWKDEYGTEVDFKVSYKIMDNLNYTFVAAFLSAGDFYWAGAATEPTNFDDVTSFFHTLQISF